MQPIQAWCWAAGEAQRVLQRESLRQQETGEQRFVQQHIISPAEQDPDPSIHLGRMRLVRTSYTPYQLPAERASMTQPLPIVKEDESGGNLGSNSPV